MSSATSSTKVAQPTAMEAPKKSALPVLLRLDAALFAAALSLGAALIHLWVVPEHAFAWWAYGAFFITVALAQGLLGVALLRWPGRWVALAGIAGNLAVVAMYVLSRTSGIPLGPHAGRPEEAGALDMAATASEVVVIVLLVGMLDGPYRRAVVNALLVLGLAVWSLRLAGVMA